MSKFYQGYLTKVDKIVTAHSWVALLARLYIAKIFFLAGLTKVQDWDTTLFFFEEEYQVPLIPFELAAYLGTVGELVLPVLLVLGFFTRFTALGLFIVNYVAVISLVEIAPAALYLHYIWGILLVQLIVYGAGVASIDGFMLRVAEVKQRKVLSYST
jgi:putative oxidoreductase